MTAVTKTPRPAGRPAIERSATPPTTRMADLVTGWYDPDATGWQSDPAAAFEAFRASPIRPVREPAHPDRDGGR